MEHRKATRMRNNGRQPQPVPITGMALEVHGEVQTFMHQDDEGVVHIAVFPFQEELNFPYEPTDREVRPELEHELATPDPTPTRPQ